MRVLFSATYFGHRAGKFEASDNTDSGHRQRVDSLGSDVLTPNALYVAYVQRFGVNYTAAFGKRAANKAIRQNLERRTDVYSYVAFPNVFTAAFTYASAAASVPRDFVKRRAAQFRPQRCLAYNFAHIKSLLCGSKNFTAHFCAFYVTVVVRSGHDAHLRANARKFCKPCFEYRRDMIIHFALLPDVLAVGIFDVAAHVNAAVLISSNEIRV